ncbi:hypothetical protein KSP40_PGU004363 [Platanthera guangdongensis]|uniref:Secreted protein n=1 Tax=Platanthera guangdongensis TaxID=2320717 RepID=A0ABR2M1F1_9ASPA
MVRLVFRPYTQVRRMICTSVSLWATTRVSSSFAPLRHISTSFRSRHACSHSNPSYKIKFGRQCTSYEFHARFDSLFKVLFILPSRYLFNIGLSPLFSLGQNLLPD